MTGGIVGNLVSSENNITNISGGRIAYGLTVNDNGILNLYGTDLMRSFSGYSGGYAFYELSGLLKDGTNIGGNRLYVQEGSRARVNLVNVPAPNSLILMAGGLAPTGVLLFHRRRKPRY